MTMLPRVSLIGLALLLAACGTVATPEWSAEVQETRVALAATAEHLTRIAPTFTPSPTVTSTPTVTPLPTNTPLPSSTPTESPTNTALPPTEPPAAVASGDLPGDPVRGQEIFNLPYAEAGYPQGCATCHLVNSEARLIGPGLLDIGTHAETRVPGQTALEYLHNSIVHPSDYVVADYPDMLMPQVYGQILSEQDINDLIAYLLTLHS